MNDPIFDPLRRVSEHTATPDPATLRGLGDRRRVRRRQALGAVAAVAVLATGAGVIVSQLGGGGGLPVPPVAPSPSATPAERRVDAENTVRARDLPVRERERWSDGPSPDAPVSPCLPELESLGAQLVVHQLQREFEGGGDPPASYSVAIQLDSGPAAEDAAAVVRGWVEECPDRLRGADEQVSAPPAGSAVEWLAAPTAVGSAGFAQVVHGSSDLDPSVDGLLWESIGIAVVGDRVAVTVDVVGPQTEYYYGTEPGSWDPATGAPPHPQFDLLAAAALRLDDQVPTAPAPSTPGGTGGTLQDSQLPQLEDFEWNETSTFSLDRAGPGDGSENLSRCQLGTPTELGAEDVALITVGEGGSPAPGDGGGGASITGGAIAMAFADEAAAERAWSTLQEWGDGCAATLEQLGTPPVAMPDVFEVPVPRGEASYRTVGIDGGGQDGVWVDYGLTRVDAVVVLASFESTGPEFIWDAEPDGPTGLTYPMIRTLQNINERLAG